MAFPAQQLSFNFTNFGGKFLKKRIIRMWIIFNCLFNINVWKLNSYSFCSIFSLISLDWILFLMSYFLIYVSLELKFILVLLFYLIVFLLHSSPYMLLRERIILYFYAYSFWQVCFSFLTLSKLSGKRKRLFKLFCVIL